MYVYNMFGSMQSFIYL